MSARPRSQQACNFFFFKTRLGVPSRRLFSWAEWIGMDSMVQLIVVHPSVKRLAAVWLSSQAVVPDASFAAGKLMANSRLAAPLVIPVSYTTVRDSAAPLPSVITNQSWLTRYPKSEGYIFKNHQNIPVSLWAWHLKCPSRLSHWRAWGLSLGD